MPAQHFQTGRLARRFVRGLTVIEVGDGKRIRVEKECNAVGSPFGRSTVAFVVMPYEE